MRKLTALAVAGVVCMAMQVSAQTPAQAPAQPKASAAPKTGAGAKTGAAAARPYDRVLLRPALLKDKAPETYQVKFSTTRGDFTLTVTRAWAPIGADRFYNLVKHHFYDNATVFRVVPGFVAQFGLSAYPPVSAAWKNANLKDDPVTQSNKKGYITFATAGPNTRTTQVFINLVDNERLDKMGFAPFGQVTAGMHAIDLFYDQYGDASGPDQDQIEKQGKPYLDKGWPKLDIINSATLIGEATAPVAKKAPTVKAAPAPKNP
jgi:peptidyl-prolyl cis-trans isomerase A (cyclophilin A)